MSSWIRRFGLIAILSLIGLTPAIAGDFLIGNLNPPSPPSEFSFVNGPQFFAYLVHPIDQTECTEQGFTLETISMMMDFQEFSLGLNVDFEVALYTADYLPSQGQYLPGAPICQSPIQTHAVMFPGLQELTGFMGPCVSMQVDDFYFLVVHILTPLEVLLPMDDLPLPGIVYRDVGLGWYDTFNGLKTAAGKLIIWGDITCSIPPISAGESTWGEIKSLYR